MRKYDETVRKKGIAMARAQESKVGETYVGIGEMAEEFGLTLRTLRFYEDKGLIAPKRVGSAEGGTKAGTRAVMSRFYSQEDREQVRSIVTLKDLGFTLGEVAEMLKKKKGGGYDLPKEVIASQIEYATRQRDALTQRIATLKNLLKKAA